MGRTSPCPPGNWCHLEAVLTRSAGGRADGAIEWWVDGVKQGRYVDVHYVDCGDAAFTGTNLQPLWGGLGGTKARTDYLWFDDLYVSGANN